MNRNSPHIQVVMKEGSVLEQALLKMVSKQAEQRKKLRSLYQQRLTQQQKKLEQERL